MIEIALYGKTNDLIEAPPHPDYIDFPARDSHVIIAEARLGIAMENFVAPIVASLNRKTAIETYPDLARAATELAQRYPRRQDGRRVIELLAAWGRPYPQARWHVSGAETITRKARYIEHATMPRLSPTSVTFDPRARRVVILGEAARMDDVDLDELDAILDFGLRSWEDISGAALLQREVRIQPTGGGTKNKGRKKSAEGGMTYVGYSESDAAREKKRKTGVVSVRVDEEAKTAIDADPESKRLVMEALGRALLSGTSYFDVLAKLTAGETVTAMNGPP